MPLFPAKIDLSSLDASVGFRLNGGGFTGQSVASAGDVNGDGFADLIVGAPYASPNGIRSGECYVVFGKASGFGSSIDLTLLDGSSGFKLSGVAALDASGWSVASAGDVNGDGFDDVIVGAKRASPNGLDSGASYVVFGKASGFGSNIALSSLDGSTGFRLDGTAAGDQSGFSVASAGDVNGDGYDDLIVGAPYANSNGSLSGASYVVFGKASDFAASLSLSPLDGSIGFRLDGAAGDRSGRSVASAGDVNGDGFADLIVGAPWATPNGSYSGASYVVFGKASGFGGGIDLSSLDGSNGFKLSGRAAFDFGGSSVASAGDVNGDGIVDLIVGAPGVNDGLGASYVVFGKASGFGAEIDLSSLDGSNGFRLDGAVRTFGYSVASAGDVNGDGYDDLIAGAPFANDLYGASYVVFGKASGFAASLSTSSLDGGNGFEINGEGFDGYTGVSVASAGDVNGDGLADLIVGAPLAGTSYVLYGRTPVRVVGLSADSGASAGDFVTNVASPTVSGTYDVTLEAGDQIQVSANGGTTWVTAMADAGTSTWSAGGVTLSPGSGFLSTRVIDLGGNATAGARQAYTLDTTGPLAVANVDLSSLDGSVGFRLKGALGNLAGFSVASAGDVNGDGFADLFVGAPRASPNGGDSGASYVVFGKSSGFGSDVDLTSLDGSSGFKLSGVAANDGTGFSAASAGDVNGDDFDDVIVSTRTAGVSYVVFGKASGFPSNIALSSLDGSTGFRLDGTNYGGLSAASAGDVNGDGHDDLIVGALNASSNGAGSGASYVVFGKASGFAASLSLSTLDGSNGFRLDGAANDHSGQSVASAGDVNGDGFADLIVGASGASPNGAGSGASYVVLGKASGFAANLFLSSLDGSAGFKIKGVAAFDYSGRSVASAGDVNGDGFADLIVGAPSADPNGSLSGASYVVFGKASGFAAEIDLSSLDGSNGFKLSGGVASGRAGYSVASAGDVNGDGHDDLIVGAPSANGGPDVSYVVFGKASGFAADIDLSGLDSSTGFEIDGTAFSGTGKSVASAGDVNGDGLADLIVGAPGASAGYVLFGRTPMRVVGLSADGGASASDFVTNVASQAVSGSYEGTLEAGDLIQVSADGGTTWVTATAAAGIWSAAGVTLSPGGGFLSTRVVDLAGNTTAGARHAYALDTVAPAIAVAASATVGATSLAGTAVTLSGTASDDGSGPVSVSLYRTITPANLIGTASVNAGAWSLSTTLAAGTYGPFIAVATDAAGNTSTTTAAFSLQTGITGVAYTAIETLFVGGNPATRIYIKADGSIAYITALNSDGSVHDIHYYGIVGEAYTDYDVVYGANGKPASTLYSNGMTATWIYDGSGKLRERIFSDVPGRVYAGYTVAYGSDGKAESTTFLLADGSTYRVKTWNADGTLHEDHQYGVVGKPYTDFETVYGAGGERLSTTYFKADGSIHIARTWNADGTRHAVHQYGFVGQFYTDVETVYGAGGERASATYFNGPTIVRTRTWNSDGTLNDIHYYGVTGQAYTDYDVVYGANGKPVSATYSDGMTATWSYYPGGGLQEIRYDGVTGRTFTARENDYDAFGDLAVTTTTNIDGTYTITGRQDGLTLFGTAANEKFVGGGVDETFAFTASIGHDTLADFAAHIAGADHDTLSLTGTAFDSFVELLAATTFSTGGALVTVDANNTISIPKLTEAVMTANSGAFSFHA